MTFHGVGMDFFWNYAIEKRNPSQTHWCISTGNNLFYLKGYTGILFPTKPAFGRQIDPL